MTLQFFVKLYDMMSGKTFNWWCIRSFSKIVKQIICELVGTLISMTMCLGSVSFALWVETAFSGQFSERRKKIDIFGVSGYFLMQLNTFQLKFV